MRQSGCFSGNFLAKEKTRWAISTNIMYRDTTGYCPVDNPLITGSVLKIYFSLVLFLFVY